MIQQDLSGMRFLITEDNLLCADILAELLRLRHASVSCVHSGELDDADTPQALARIKSE